jgi:hypothetical protein
MACETLIKAGVSICHKKFETHGVYGGVNGILQMFVFNVPKAGFEMYEY